MPIFEYKCKFCNHITERIVRIVNGNKQLIKCEKCKKMSSYKIISTFNTPKSNKIIGGAKSTKTGEESIGLNNVVQKNSTNAFKTTFLNGAGFKINPQGPGNFEMNGLNIVGGNVEADSDSVNMRFKNNNVDVRKEKGLEMGGNLRIKSGGSIEANRNIVKKDIEIDGDSSVQANDNIAGHSPEDSDK